MPGIKSYCKEFFLKECVMKKWIFVLIFMVMPQCCSAAIIADSLDDWSVTGTQGQNSWLYGYYNLTADGDGMYQPEDFVPYLNDVTGVISATNQWDGNVWRMAENPPPFSYVGPGNIHPDGTDTSSEELWPIRRWVSTIDGSVRITTHLHAVNLSGSGTSNILYINGTKIHSYATDSLTGVTMYFDTDLHVGDVVDLALTPEGVDGLRNGTSDGSYNRLTIPEPTTLLLLGGGSLALLRRRRKV
jgi:hypothetical protein